MSGKWLWGVISNTKTLKKYQKELLHVWWRKKKMSVSYVMHVSNKSAGDFVCRTEASNYPNLLWHDAVWILAASAQLKPHSRQLSWSWCFFLCFSCVCDVFVQSMGKCALYFCLFFFNCMEQLNQDPTSITNVVLRV